MNDIDVEGARHLAEALKVNSSLQTLQYVKTQLTDQSSRALLRHCQRSLSCCGIGAEGVRHLAEALKSNCTLQMLEYVDT